MLKKDIIQLLKQKDIYRDISDSKLNKKTKKELEDLLSTNHSFDHLLSIDSEQTTLGITYSQAHYNEFYKNGDQNLFEEIIDKMMLDGFAPELKEKILNLPLNKKRMAILAYLDNDRKLFTEIKSLIVDNVSKMEHIKDIITMLRKYVKVGEVEKKKYGEVMTPLELVKDMLTNLPKEVWSNPNLKWLDSCNGAGAFLAMVTWRLMDGLKDWEPDENKRYKHIIENMIYAGELQPKNMFLWMCFADPYDEYKLNVYTGSFLENGFDRHMKEVWKVDKFDVVLGNPPYQGNLHLKFLSKSSYICVDKILFVHPSSWLIKDTSISKIEKDCKELIGKHKCSLRFINGNITFGIKLFVPCIITYISASEKNDGFHVLDSINNRNMFFKSVNDINLLSDTDLFFRLKNKFLNLSKKSNLYNSVRNGSYYVSISRIRGNVCDVNMIKDDFYTFVPKDRSVSKFKAKTDGANYGFDSEKDADNFLAYLKSNFARFSLLLFKYNADLANRPAIKYVPWLDFSQEWTDEKLKKEFNLTTEEVDFINKNIPKYY